LFPLAIRNSLFAIDQRLQNLCHHRHLKQEAAMDWNAQIGRDLRALDGIVAILLALADLAERAAGASDPVRCAMLWFLRQADTVAAEFVAASACAARPRKSPCMTTDRSDPVDAINLASSLRMLAVAVEAMLTRLRRRAFLHQPSGGKASHRPLQDMRSVLQAAIARSERRDTS
jgi:hypothetical protein